MNSAQFDLGIEGIGLEGHPKYSIERLLQRGAWGTVYLAKEVATGEEFAIKVSTGVDRVVEH